MSHFNSCSKNCFFRESDYFAACSEKSYPSLNFLVSFFSEQGLGEGIAFLRVSCKIAILIDCLPDFCFNCFYLPRERESKVIWIWRYLGSSST